MVVFMTSWYQSLWRVFTRDTLWMHRLSVLNFRNGSDVPMKMNYPYLVAEVALTEHRRLWSLYFQVSSCVMAELVWLLWVFLVALFFCSATSTHT
jgi:hypothetical protein